MSILYIPFSRREENDHLRALAVKWVGAVAQDRRWKNQPRVVIHGAMESALCEVQPDETVYVLAHGMGSAEYIAAKQDFPTAVLDPATLADRIRGDGLSRLHRRIKLYICEVSAHMEDFATAFKAEMVQRGYAQLKVEFYMSAVSVPVGPDEHGHFHKRGVVMVGHEVVSSGGRASAYRFEAD